MTTKRTALPADYRKWKRFVIESLAGITAWQNASRTLVPSATEGVFFRETLLQGADDVQQISVHACATRMLLLSGTRLKRLGGVPTHASRHRHLDGNRLGAEVSPASRTHL